MATYATTDWLAGRLDSVTDEEVEWAEQQVDLHIGNFTNTGPNDLRKLCPDTLQPRQAEALRQVLVILIRFRRFVIESDPHYFIRPERESAQAKGIAVTGTLEKFPYEAARLLADNHMVDHSALGRHHRPWHDIGWTPWRP